MDPFKNKIKLKDCEPNKEKWSTHLEEQYCKESAAHTVVQLNPLLWQTNKTGAPSEERICPAMSDRPKCNAGLLTPSPRPYVT